MDGWMDEWINEWMGEWIDKWMDEWTNKWMDEWIMDGSKPNQRTVIFSFCLLSFDFEASCLY